MKRASRKKKTCWLLSSTYFKVRNTHYISSIIHASEQHNMSCLAPKGRRHKTERTKLLPSACKKITVFNLFSSPSKSCVPRCWCCHPFSLTDYATFFIVIVHRIAEIRSDKARQTTLITMDFSAVHGPLGFPPLYVIHTLTPLAALAHGGVCLRITPCTNNKGPGF